ncbi:MAG: hypothetical protein H6626_13050 [Pseudobdellovibrionaceae bacterium]|nr:MAG: hypothetical protein H6626_13050 [Pseudobdellovibrionaceae bacterium]
MQQYLKQTIFLLALVGFFTGCPGVDKPENDDLVLPSVTISAPNPSTGDISTTFQFSVVYTNAASVSLLEAKVDTDVAGDVVCAPPIVVSPDTANPTIELTGCTGNGTVSVTILAGTSYSAAGTADAGSIPSPTATVINSVLPSCPDGYVPVPNDGINTTEDFCVMKFEAKAEIDAAPGTYNDNGCDGTGSDCTGSPNNWGVATHTPRSVEDAKPWRKIDRVNANAECRSLNSESSSANIDSDTNGDGTFNLIANAEWQTIAQNIEMQSTNWSGGAVGSGCIFQGNNGGAGCGYDGADPEGGPVASRDSRGKHVISTGEFIWDLAANVVEWVAEDSSFAYGPDSYVSTWTPMFGISGPLGYPKPAFGPLGDYTSANAGNSYAGLGFGYINHTAGAIWRGGYWVYGVSSGIFAVNFTNSPTLTNSPVGFRCSFTPP